MTHPQVFGQKITPIRRFLARKTHPFWPHIPNMTQYGSAPPDISCTESQIPNSEAFFDGKSLFSSVPSGFKDILLRQARALAESNPFNDSYDGFE